MLETETRDAINGRNTTGPAVPDHFSRPQDPYREQYSAYTQPATGPNWKPYVAGAVMAILVAVIINQQLQINSLSRDVGTLTNDMRTSDVPVRLDNAEKSLDQMNTRLSYLDSKINATDQKAQSALNQLKANENAGNAVGNFFNYLGKNLGLNQ